MHDVVPVLVTEQAGDVLHELVHDGVMYVSIAVLQDVLHQVVAAGYPEKRTLSVLDCHSVQTLEFKLYSGSADT